MRSLLILLAGALVGALVAFSAANTLNQRNAWSRGVMHVLQHHLGELRRLQRAGDCAPMRTVAHFQRLAQTAADIGPSHREEKPDFHEQAKRFIDATGGFATTAPADCAALDAAVQQVGNACQGCHRDYR